MLGLEQQVVQPAVEEVGGVERERCGCRESCDVAGPPQALITLRAVGRDTQEVAALTPDGVLDELRDERLGARESSRPRHLRMDHDGLEVSRAELAGPPVDLGVAETVEREGGLERVDPTRENKLIGRLRVAERPDAQLAVLEDLCVTDADDVPAGALHPKPEPAHEVLPEVHENTTRR